MTAPWLSVVGIGEDGPDGLTDEARHLVGSADLLAGGKRHLAMIPEGAAQRMVWPTPFAQGIDALVAFEGRPVCVLASGDPQWFGVGVTLAKRFGAGNLRIFPHPGAFSLAASRLGWALQDVTCLSIHGRAFAALAQHLHPGARLLILSENGASPARLVAFLLERGLPASRLCVFENLGGPAERRRDALAADWSQAEIDDLNTIALQLPDDPNLFATPSRLAGLPDDVFAHDGQLTKREVRSVTLASLAPWPGALLWDIGAGAGSIAIEWCRAGGRAVAVERDARRGEVLRHNADHLGVPDLDIRIGDAATMLPTLSGSPDAIFIGGGLSVPGLIDQCWAALSPGGRLAANAVTAESEAILLSWQAQNGGALSRINVSRLAGTGRFQTWHSLMPVTHFLGIKP